MDDMARSTAIPEITPAIAAAYGARMPRIHWCAVRWVYCHDIGMLEELRDELWRSASSIAATEKWRDPGDAIEVLVDLALVEKAQTIWGMGVECGACGGDGWESEEHGEECSKCSGSGIIEVQRYPIKTAVDRYGFVGWNEQRWYRWRHRYQSIYQILDEWEGRGVAHIMRAQRATDEAD